MAEARKVHVRVVVSAEKVEPCPHASVKVFRVVPPHAKCLDCGARVEQRWVTARPHP